ncbi:hypothetical protein D3C71_2135170 [compost metagenome]
MGQQGSDQYATDYTGRNAHVDLQDEALNDTGKGPIHTVKTVGVRPRFAVILGRMFEDHPDFFAD